MPFHIPGSQMNAFPPPFLFSSLSPPILPFFYPHLHTVPASFPQLLSQAGHNIGGGMRTGGWGGRGGKEEDMCIWVWWEEETDADIPTQGICLQVCLHLRGNVWLFPCICVLVWNAHGAIFCHTPCCCSNSFVTTAVWHLSRMNLFHSEWSY